MTCVAPPRFATVSILGLGPLHEHPAMAFQVFGAVALPILTRFDAADDGSPVLLRPREVGIDIVDVDQHAVDDVRNRGPFLGRLAALSVVARRLIVGRWSGQHDDAVAGLHFAMAEAAVLAEHPRPLLE